MDNNKLNGTFLIYPDSLDVRGAAQGKKEAINFFQTLFNIADEKVSNDNIRFEENLKKLF